MVAETVINARYQGEEVRCGACDRVIGVGVIPFRVGARLPCKSCGAWVILPLRGG